MKFENNIPIYLQIVNLLKKDIINGKYKLGEKLPSVREISQYYKINQNTALKSYNILEEENIIEIKRGIGYFVLNDEKVLKELEEKKIKEIFSKFLKEILEFNYSKEEVIEYLKEMEWKC